MHAHTIILTNQNNYQYLWTYVLSYGGIIINTSLPKISSRQILTVQNLSIRG
jgi:hypothetical protein